LFFICPETKSPAGINLDMDKKTIELIIM